MTKREHMISVLVRRVGGMRTMLLVGLINNFPKKMNGADGGTEHTTAWFAPSHGELQRTLQIKTPVYWALMRGLCDRGLVHKRVTEQRGHEYQIDFGAMDIYCRYGRIELILGKIRQSIGLKPLLLKQIFPIGGLDGNKNKGGKP